MNQFAPLQQALMEDMTELLPKSSGDPDNFGFALAVPESFRRLNSEEVQKQGAAFFDY